MCDMDGILPELDRLEALFSPPPGVPIPPQPMIAQAIVHLLSRVQDDLQSQFFFHLEQQDVRFYGQKALFGEAVAKKFQGATDDIERAGNCFALQQPTACVFHLMRAMETAVRQLGKRLKVTITPQTTWRQMTHQMDDKIKKMSEKTEVQKRRKNEWEAARANLHHVGSVWRNNTMHPFKCNIAYFYIQLDQIFRQRSCQYAFAPGRYGRFRRAFVSANGHHFAWGRFFRVFSVRADFGNESRYCRLAARLQ